MDTYLVRVFRPAADAPVTSEDALHGTAQHLRTGAVVAFTSAEELCSLLAVDLVTPT